MNSCTYIHHHLFRHGLKCCPVCLRTTEVPHDMVEDLLTDLQPRFRPQDYNLLFNNCNHFSNELSLLLTGNGIPVSTMQHACTPVLHLPCLVPMLHAVAGHVPFCENTLPHR